MWDSSSDALITFNYDNFIGNLAYIIENDILLFAILNEIEKKSNIVIQNDARIDKIQLESENGKTNEIHLTTGEQFSAELLVSNCSFIREKRKKNNNKYSYSRITFILKQI